MEYNRMGCLWNSLVQPILTFIITTNLFLNLTNKTQTYLQVILTHITFFLPYCIPILYLNIQSWSRQLEAH